MVIRQSNLLGQMRIDVPHLRAMESSVAADFDVASGQMLAGRQALVLKGFNVVMTGAIGAQASALLISVADGLLMHWGASESGTIFWVPSNRAPEVMASTNTKVSGSFAASQTNYLGLDLRRQADDSTADNVQFLPAGADQEVSKTVPLARTLDYRFVISTQDFSSQPNVLPIAIVTTNSANAVTAVSDTRQMMFRLGLGGDFANIHHAYPWPGTRAENLSGDIFSGGDKSIGSMKEWMDAAMTRMQEIGGGEYWYSATADRNVNLIWTGSAFTNGENFEWTGTNLHWKGLRFLFDNSTGYFNDVADQTSDSAGLTDLADGQCLYVDLDRTQNATGGSALLAAKGTLITMGASVVAGARFILAWRNGAQIFTRQWRYPVGTTFQPATTSSLGEVEINQTAANPSLPVTISLMTNNVAVLGTGTFPVASNAGGSGFDAFTSTGGDITVGTVTFRVGGSGLKGIGGQAHGTSHQIAGTGVTGQGGACDSGTAGAGTGVIGIGGTSGGGGALDGVGGAFQGGGTNGVGAVITGQGTGDALQATASGSGLAVKAIGGNVQVTSTKDFTYDASRTLHYHISPMDIRAVGMDSGANFPAQVFGAVNTIAKIQTTGASSSYVAEARFVLPIGAQVTGFEFCFDSTASTAISNVEWDTVFRVAGGYNIDNTIFNGGTFTVNGAMSWQTPTWSTSGSGGIIDDHYTVLRWACAAPGGGQTLNFYGARITYTLAKVNAGVV